MGFFDKIFANKKKKNKKTSKANNNPSKTDNKPSNVYKGYDLGASKEDKINMINNIYDQNFLAEIYEREPNSTVCHNIILKINDNNILASLFYLNEPNQYNRSLGTIFSKISDELIITEMLCYTEMEYGISQYLRDPDLLMLVSDFAPNSMNRSAASRARYEMVGDAPFDENNIIDAINHFKNEQALTNVKNRAHSGCQPFHYIDDFDTYRKIEETAKKCLNEL